MTVTKPPPPAKWWRGFYCQGMKMCKLTEKTSSDIIIKNEREVSKMSSYGYIRVSTQEQNEDRQRISMGRFIADLVLQILSFVAESERHNINKRQMEGIAAAKARGVRFGRPPRSLPDNFYVVVKRWKKKEITLREATKLCNMSVSTFYRRMKEV